MESRAKIANYGNLVWLSSSPGKAPLCQAKKTTLVKGPSTRPSICGVVAVMDWSFKVWGRRHAVPNVHFDQHNTGDDMNPA